MEGQKTKPTTNYEYKRLLEAVKTGIICFIPDDDFTIQWATDYFYKRSGYSEEEYRERFKTMRQYYAGYTEDFGRIKDIVKSTLEKKEEDVELITCMPQKNGGFLHVSVSVAFSLPDAEKPLCYAAYKKLSKERVREEELSRLLKKNTEYFEWMLDEYVGNVYISDIEDHELLYINPNAAETIKLSPKQVLGHKCYEIIQGKDAPCSFCTNDRLTEEQFYEWEFFNPVLDRTFMIKNRIIEWKGHRARLELSHDNFSMEYKLAKKDREREAILRTVPGGLARVDARDMNTVLWYGGGFLEMIGYTKEQFKEELHSQCNYMHPEDKERIQATLKKAKRTGEATIVEARIITRNQETKILTITLSYVSCEDSWDGVECFYSIGIDVTKERKEQAMQRAALEDACKAARVASAAKTNFLSCMSHDIRTPMNAIMGMTAIAKTRLDSPEKMSSCLDKIETSGRHLLSLINEVLDMSKIESGKIDLTLAKVNLPDMLQKITDMCRPLADINNQQMRISAGQVQHETIITDGDRLQQVLMNLLSNAIKYTPEGGKITLRMNELTSPTPGKGQYEFVCEDNGIGIPKEFMPLIFEPFSRADDPRISKLQGTGLGMTITENIIRMMNGTIEVQSREGAGTRFVVTVPFELCKEETLANQPHLSEDTMSAADEEEEKRNTMALPDRVLLAEDNDINREIVVELLQMYHIKVDAVQNGQRAVEAFDKSDSGIYKAILMDIQMPVLNGYDAAVVIRSLEREDAKTVPIIALTADAFASDVAKARSAGMNDHIAKPVEVDALLETLQKWTS